MSRLGRGLSDILSEVDEAYEKEIANRSGVDDVYELDIDHIVANPHQPRSEFDQESLNQLAQSIKTHGILQPIIVKKDDDGFLLLAGERRLRAAKIAGFETVKAIVTDVAFDKFRELALIENIQREDLNPLEIAYALKNLIDQHSLTHDDLAKRLKKSRTQITNTLRLLALSEYAQAKLRAQELHFGHAKLLVGLTQKQEKLAVDSIVGQKLSVRESEKLIAKIKNRKSSKKSATEGLKGTEYVDLTQYKNILKKELPIRCEIKKRKIEISFENEDEIETFLKYFKG